MKIPSPARIRGLGFDMTPMIDVVFLLIIFFLVSSHMAKQEVQFPLELPVAASGEPDVPDERPAATINVAPDRKITLAGRPVPAEELQARLAELRSEAGEDVQIRVRLDRDLPYEALEPTLLACARAGIANVQIAVFREEGDR